jgi:hypothetical protein
LSVIQSKETNAELLKRTSVRIAPATFYLVGLAHEDWNKLLQNPELSPRSDAPFMLLRDDRETTLLLEEADWLKMQHAVPGARVESNFRLVTLDIELAWNIVGFLAHVTQILAEAEISVGALSAFSRDHLLIKQDDLGKALRALSPHIGELC